MISLQPIPKKIRDRLEQKCKAVSRDFGKDESGTLLEPRSEDLQDTFSKSVWIKLFSPVDSSKVPAVLPITDEIREEWRKNENEKRASEASNAAAKGDKYVPIEMTEPTSMVGEKDNDIGLNTMTMMGGITDQGGLLFEGFKETYSQRPGGAGSGPLASVASKEGPVESFRPIAGIKDVSVSYKGGLSAIREGTINWTCWTFADLERLMPHLMSHGKGVLLEWGWSIPSVEASVLYSEEQMQNGHAYNTLQDKVIELGGDYDAMAGIISNWEWSLRDDGGFDCTTTIVARGVNIIDSDLSGAETAGENTEGDLEPNLKEFVGALRQTLWSLSTKGTEKFLSVGSNLAIGNVSDDTWSTTGTQPPGVLSLIHDNFLNNVSSGPWITWGFFEDNILGKFMGRVDSTGKTTQSFRSIEPLLHKDGGYIKNDGKTQTDHLYEAQFESVKIRNHPRLLTPAMNKWILPGQFPAEHTVENAFFATGNTAAFTVAVATIANNTSHFSPFEVPGSDGRKGYLRNIILSYDLIERCFENANTIREGMNAIFDELNKEVDGFWKFEVVVDQHINGNVKVIDTLDTAFNPVSMLDARDAAISAGGNGNPESPIFTFPSWGEKSIVKSQTLTSAVPSSMAVSAMYAGTCEKGEESANAPLSAQAVAALTDPNKSIDKSQPAIRMANRLGDDAFGSRNPWGAESFGSRFSSDNSDETYPPAGPDASENAFGKGAGIPFSKVSLKEIIDWYESQPAETEKKDESERLKKLQEKAANQKAKSKKSVGYFNDAFKNPSALVHVVDDNVGFFADMFGGEEDISLYNPIGELQDLPAYDVLHRRVMINFIHGRSNSQDATEELDSLRDPMIPVELEIVLDGTGGIIPGNCFHVDYIPQVYKDYCIFQVLGADHTVSADGWTTSLKGQVRVAMRKLVEEKLKPTT
jgi:hypothetical protein